MPSAFMASRSLRGLAVVVVVPGVYRGARPPPSWPLVCRAIAVRSAACCMATAWRPSGARIGRTASPCGDRITLMPNRPAGLSGSNAWRIAPLMRLGLDQSPGRSGPRFTGGAYRAGARGALGRTAGT
ncbi:MAG: hypothetical protein EBR23_08350 [Planctomycetia bacterium]|nr:hypothetical protein [Planctomycetia bacterium]